MEIAFIPCYFTKNISDEQKKKIASALKDFTSIGIFSTVQFENQKNEIKKFLQSNEKKVEEEMGRQTRRCGIVLGCDSTAPLITYESVDAFLYIGDGQFHPVNLAVKLDKKEKPIFTFNPISGEIKRLDAKKAEAYIKYREKALKSFKGAKSIGIIVTTKYGQNNLSQAVKLKEKLELQNKNVYIFMTDNLDPNQQYNFPQIDFWINTACPRIGIDDYSNYPKQILNFNELN